MSKNKVIVLDQRLIKSTAWLNLRGNAQSVYLLFRTKCQLTKHRGRPGKRSDEWVISNNGEITFSYKEAKKKYGITASRFVRAIDELIAKGFIDIVKSGLGIHRLTTLYAISLRWKMYGTPLFEMAIRPKAANNQGFKKKSSNVIVTSSSNVIVTRPRYLVLRTCKEGKVHKTEFKFSDNKWLPLKYA